MTTEGVEPMVNVTQLRDAKWDAWDIAAKGWRTFAEQAVFAGKDIRAQGRDKLDDHWKDQVGQAAGQVLEGLANEYDIASDLMRAVAMVLEGLAEAVELAQGELRGAAQLAHDHYLRLDDNGVAEPWDKPDSQGDNGYYEALEWKPKVENMVRDAVEAATQADQLATDQLRKLAAAATMTNDEDALNLQGEASRAEITMTHLAVPYGQPPEVVAAWWNSLTDAERTAVERAVPVDLADLNGIPENVKAELRGPGPLDRVELVRYATEHWHDPSLDDDDSANCTRFLSTVLAHAGMPETSGWTHSVWGIFGPTHSWTSASDLPDYLLTRTHSREVPRNEARPGDILCLRQLSPSVDEHAKQGRIYHVAVVTSVTPTGSSTTPSTTPTCRTAAWTDGSATSASTSVTRISSSSELTRRSGEMRTSQRIWIFGLSVLLLAVSLALMVWGVDISEPRAPRETNACLAFISRPPAAAFILVWLGVLCCCGSIFAVVVAWPARFGLPGWLAVVGVAAALAFASYVLVTGPVWVHHNAIPHGQSCRGG